MNLARREQLTVRQLIGRLGGGRGHRTFSGTPEQVADAIQDWFQAGAADGFNIMPPVLPSGLDIFVDQVVPILQDRGLFRHEYTGHTLREHFGLAVPANSFAEAKPKLNPTGPGTGPAARITNALKQRGVSPRPIFPPEWARCDPALL